MLSILVLAMVGVIPDPYSDLGLNDKQTKQVESIVTRFQALETQAHSKEREDNSKGIAKTIESLHNRRDSEIEKVLTNEQKAKLAEIRKQQKEGVPIGSGFFRSFKVDDYFIPSTSGARAMSLEEYGRSIQESASRAPDGIKFTVTNRGGKDCKTADIKIEAFNAQGARIDVKTTKVKDLKDGQSQEIKILYEKRSEVSRFEIAAENVKE